MVETDPAKIAACRDRLAKVYRSQPSLTYKEKLAATLRHMRQSGMLPSDESCAPADPLLAAAVR